jgi:vacuolar-type H+-ATPase subunit I/STV1
MKKITIITPPEYELQILEALGKTGVTQFKPITSSEFEALRGTGKQQVDWNALYSKVHTRFTDLEKLGDLKVEYSKPATDELTKFTLDPNTVVNKMTEELDNLMAELKEKQEDKFRVGNKLVEELQAKIGQRTKASEETKKAYDEEQRKLSTEMEAVQVRLESVQALEPEELKKCFAVGVVKKEIASQIEEYLKRYPDVFLKTVEYSKEECFIFVFSSEERRKWVEALFLVFDVRDIFDILDPNDILLVLDSAKRQEAIKKYSEELKKLEDEQADKSFEDKNKKLDEELKKEIEDLKAEYDRKIKENEDRHAAEHGALKKEQSEILSKVAYYDQLLANYASNRVQVLRSNVISVLQGYTPESRVPELSAAIESVEKELGERFFIQIEDPGHDEKNVPTPPMYFKPSFLQPLWTLTTLRGWPSSFEINPGYITILIFCFQFGLMFGDIGQGLIFLLIGIFLSRKFKRGMMSKLGTLFVPMGISAIIFGFLYDSIFLLEGLLYHHHTILSVMIPAPIYATFTIPLPNPITNTTGLMKLVFMIAAIEVIIGLIFGAINQIRQGNPVGALGEHGLGMILYIVGLYLSAMYFIQIGMNFMAVLSHWTFYMMLGGMALSFLEPVIHSIQHGHGIGMESIGEGVGGLLMTFVEGLANLFSFLRIAAFALAHASLAVAAEALTEALGITGIGLIIMNVIALSFEFVSSSVQSLRLLYYEFMGKFFTGGGEPFKPFMIRRNE